jgi:hypothetical protein
MKDLVFHSDRAKGSTAKDAAASLLLRSSEHSLVRLRDGSAKYTLVTDSGGCLPGDRRGVCHVRNISSLSLPI